MYILECASRVFTDRYHPGVASYRLGKNLTVLHYEMVSTNCDIHINITNLTCCHIMIVKEQGKMFGLQMMMKAFTRESVRVMNEMAFARLKKLVLK